MAAKLMLMTALAAGAAALTPPQLDQPGYAVPVKPWSDIEQPSRELECRERIRQARAAAGEPPIEPRTASPEKPILHYAVDRKVDGCGVLVAVGDPAGMIPPPKPGPPILYRPAQAE